jgi:hypothetical protein
MSVQDQQVTDKPSFNKLRDNLVDLSSQTGQWGCVLGKIANSLDEDTKEALCAAMASSASSSAITNSLRDAGMIIARSTIGQKRACFTENGSHMCACFPNLYTGESQ